MNCVHSAVVKMSYVADYFVQLLRVNINITGDRLMNCRQVMVARLTVISYTGLKYLN